MLLNKGIPLKEAYNWNPCGCVETNLEGKQRCYTAYADFNLGSAVEFALLNGKSRKYGIQASEATGDPTAFNTYEEFEEAVKEQMHLDIDKKKIQLKEQIKTLGTHIVSVKLHPEVTAELKVSVKEA